MYWQRTRTLEKGVFFGMTISWWDVFGKAYHVINCTLSRERYILWYNYIMVGCILEKHTM
jgi:hypothetical protein